MQVEIPKVNSFHCVCEDQDIISDEIYPNVKSAITKIIQSEGYLSYHIKTKQRKTDGSNYMSKTFEIDIKGTTVKVMKETHLFMKQALAGDGLSGIVKMADIFSKEIFFYTDLNVLFETLQKKAGIPPNRTLNHVKCFSESNSEAIIMENLSKRGFRMLHRMDILPLSFARLSVKELAKFHALSFILREKMPEYYEEKLKTIKISLNFNKEYKKIAANILRAATRSLDENTKNKIRKDFDIHLDRYIKYFKASPGVNCVCHGDFRLSNILAREIDNEVVEVVPIDYQTLFYGSPIVDLTYLIYMNSDRTFRQNHEDALKTLYFESLKEFLNYFDIDVETVYSEKMFIQDCEKAKEFGFYISLFVLPLIYAKENEVPDFEQTDVVDMSFNVDDKFVKLISELCEDFSYLLQ